MQDDSIPYRGKCFVTNCTPTSKTTVWPRHRRKLYFSSIGDEISILYELDMVTKLQRSPRKSKLHATGSLAVAYIISPTTCIFQNAIICILVIQAAACIRAYAAATCIRASCSMLQHATSCRTHYAGMQASYAHMQPAYARTAAFMQGRMQPACLPSVNPALQTYGWKNWKQLSHHKFQQRLNIGNHAERQSEKWLLKRSEIRLGCGN